MRDPKTLKDLVNDPSYASAGTVVRLLRLLYFLVRLIIRYVNGKKGDEEPECPPFVLINLNEPEIGLGEFPFA